MKDVSGKQDWVGLLDLVIMFCPFLLFPVMFLWLFYGNIMAFYIMILLIIIPNIFISYIVIGEIITYFHGGKIKKRNYNSEFIEILTKFITKMVFDKMEYTPSEDCVINYIYASNVFRNGEISDKIPGSYLGKCNVDDMDTGEGGEVEKTIVLHLNLIAAMCDENDIAPEALITVIVAHELVHYVQHQEGRWNMKGNDIEANRISHQLVEDVFGVDLSEFVECGDSS